MNKLYDDAKALYDGSKKYSEFTKGEAYVLESYNPGTGEVVINEVIWEEDLEGFDIALEEYNIDRFYLAYSGSSLMTILNYLLCNGFQISGSEPQECYKGYSVPCIMVDRKIARRDVKFVKDTLKLINKERS